jgi:hypothetical protein
LTTLIILAYPFLKINLFSEKKEKYRFSGELGRKARKGRGGAQEARSFRRGAEIRPGISGRMRM